MATSTLAWGVNTPAHLVIIKGTEFYDAHTKWVWDAMPCGVSPAPMNRHSKRRSTYSMGHLPESGSARASFFLVVPCRRYVDYPITDVLQMMGRAGRPQFDRHGVAVIMVGCCSVLCCAVLALEQARQ